MSKDTLDQSEGSTLKKDLLPPNTELQHFSEEQKTGDSVKEMVMRIYERCLENERTTETMDLLIKLKEQYTKMCATLEKYEIRTKGIPTWDQVEKGLTTEVLEKALKLARPTLLLVPPTSLQSKVEAINKQNRKNQFNNHDTVWSQNLEDHNLWNGGKLKTNDEWNVCIVEGIMNVPTDKDICDGKKTRYEMIKLLVKKYQDQGFDVINDAHTYLTLVMLKLAEGFPLDPSTATIINSKNMTETSHTAVGVWIACYYHLIDDDSAKSRDDLRLRALVEINIPKTSFFSELFKKREK